MSWLGSIFRKVADLGEEADKLAQEAVGVFQKAHDLGVAAIAKYHDKATELHDRLYELGEEADNVRVDLQGVEGARAIAEKQLEAVKGFLGQ